MSIISQKKILIVCTANVCRSPMVEGILRQRIHDAGLAQQVHVESAGVFGLQGYGASDYSVDILAEHHIDISAHRARALTDWQIAEADLIIVMEEAHRRSIFTRAPEQLDRVILLSELAKKNHDLPDPYGLGRDEYEEVYREIDATLEAGWPIILRALDIQTG